MTQAFNLSQFANKVNTSGQADLTTAVTGTLPIANGGTGLTAVGSNGEVLQSNGSALVFGTVPTGLTGMQCFTSSGTFTVPAGITKVKVTVQGAGGKGGNGAPSSYQGSGYGGGGGGGGTAIGFVTGLIPAASITVTVGVGTGSNGTSSFGAYVSATAGGNGTTPPSKSNGVAGAGGAGSGGNLNLSGNSGGLLTTNIATVVSQMGGESIFGYQVSGGGTSNTINYGSGGNGGIYPSGAGGDGGNGFVLVEW